MPGIIYEILSNILKSISFGQPFISSIWLVKQNIGANEHKKESMSTTDAPWTANLPFKKQIQVLSFLKINFNTF